MNTRRCLFLCSLWLLCFPAAARDAIRLSNKNVLDVQIDALDRVWVGTLGGLNCFDGIENHQFTKQSGALPFNLINSVCIDRVEPRVWVALQKSGVACYDLRTGRFTYYRASDEVHPLANDDVTHIEQGPDGDIWMSTFTKGVDRLNPRTGEITHYNEELYQEYRNLSLHTFKLRGDQLVLGAWKSGLHFFSLTDHSWTEFHHDAADPASLSDDSVRSLLVDSRGRLWVGTTDGLNLYQDGSRDFLVFRHRDNDPQSLPGKTVFDMKEDADGNLLLAMDGGVLAALDIREQGLPLSRRPFYVLTVDGLERDPDLRKIALDRFGNLWIGSEGDGLHFRSHRTAGAGRMDLPGTSREVTGMVRIPGGYALCSKEGEVTAFSGEGDSFRDIVRLPGADHLSCLLLDSDGRWWVGSENAGLRVTDGGRTEGVRLSDDANSPVRALLEDGPLIWVGTDRGLYGIDRRSRRTLHFLTRPGVLSDNQVRALYKDREGLLWVGTYGHGVTVLDPQLSQVAILDLGNGLPFDTVNHIAGSASGHIWVATAAGVVEFSNAREPALRTVTSRDGLTDDDVCAVAEDVVGRIWMSTNSGLSCFDHDGRIFNLDRREGLPDAPFRVGAVCATDTGHLLFGSTDGLGWVGADALEDSGSMPPAEFLPDRGSRGWTTDWRNNVLRVRFRVPDYTYTDNAEYAYRIAGMDSQWILCGKELTFNHLPYGKHTLQVRSHHYAGDWEDNTSEAVLTIRPPLWWTWWARVLYMVLAVCALVLFIWRMSRRHVQRQKERLERDMLLQSRQLGEERMAFYTNMTRDLQIPLSRILEPLNLLSSDPGLSGPARTRADEAARQTRNLIGQVEQLVEFRRTDAGHRQLSVRHADLSAFLLDFGRRFEPSLNDKPDVRFVSEIDPDVVLWFDADVLAMILGNLLTYAGKYTEKGEIRLSLHREWDRIRLGVQDSGRGIPEDVKVHLFDPYYKPEDDAPDSPDTVIGLALVKKLCDLHKIDIALTSRLGQGSEFRMLINPAEHYPEALHPELSRE